MTRKAWIKVFAETLLGMVALSIAYIIIWRFFPPFVDRHRVFTGGILIMAPFSAEAMIRIRENSIGMLAAETIKKKWLIWVRVVCWILAIGLFISHLHNDAFNFSVWFMVVVFLFETSRRLEQIPKLKTNPTGR